MSFQDELEKMIMDNAILGVDSGQAYFVDLDQAVTSIINLVDKEVIGEDESDEADDGEIMRDPVMRNRLRASQRAIIRGNDETL